ncbi:MAG: hypothetical protein SPH45_06880, partial [Gemmiger qucibialis]|nr:hypothetical protein [Gemmiger qucibialis]
LYGIHFIPSRCMESTAFNRDAFYHAAWITLHSIMQLRHGICVAKMLDKTSSIICAFGLASAAPRSPYRHLELCGVALGVSVQRFTLKAAIPG